MQSHNNDEQTSVSDGDSNDESWPSQNRITNNVFTPLLKEKSLYFETSLSVDSSHQYYDAIKSNNQQLLTSSLLQNRTDSEADLFSPRPSLTSDKSMASSVRSSCLFRSSSLSVSCSDEYEKQEMMCSNFQAFMVLLRGNTGPGILSLPVAFKYGGLWVGLGGFLLIALVAIQSLHIVVRCSSELERRYGIRTKNYADVVEYVFFYGHPRLKRYSKFMRYFTNCLMQCMQFGVCCVYVVFIATNVEKILSVYWSNGPSVRVYEVCTYVLILPYLMVKNLRTLSFFSVFANILYVVGLVLIFQYILQGIPGTDQRRPVGSWATLPLFFGTSLFAYEGVNVCIPVRNNMKTPNDMGGPAGVLNLCMVSLTSLYTAAGFYGYLKFGESTQGSISLNLPQGDWLAISVDSIFSIMVFFSMAVQFYIPVNVIWPAVQQRLESRCDLTASLNACIVSRGSLANCLTRFVLISLILVVALLVPHIELLISLVGALLGTMMAIVLPGILELVRLQATDELTCCGVVKNVSIICFGIVGLVTGTYTSLVEIINTF